MEKVRVAVALGSNLGDRERTIHSAIETLKFHLQDLAFSSFYETDPVGYADQPAFLNAAVVGATSLSAHDLLEFLIDIERRFGRTRSFPNAPRTLDLDLILYGDVVMDEPALRLPHPRFRERRFVLDPLSEIAADWLDPVTGLNVGQLRSRLVSSS